MAENIFFADIPEDIEQEVFFLYKLGVGIEEIEYIISRKLKKLSN